MSVPSFTGGVRCMGAERVASVSGHAGGQMETRGRRAQSNRGGTTREERRVGGRAA